MINQASSVMIRTHTVFASVMHCDNKDFSRAVLAGRGGAGTERSGWASFLPGKSHPSLDRAQLTEPDSSRQGGGSVHSARLSHVQGIPVHG